MLPGGSAVELVDPNLLPAHVVGIPRVVLDVNPEICRSLLRFLQGCLKTGDGKREREERERDCQNTGVDCDVCCCLMDCVKKKEYCFRA